MKTIPCFRMGNWIFCTILFVFCAHSFSWSQEVYARTFFTKVDPANIEQYLKIIREQVKPALQLAKKNGEITDWDLYSVHNTGTDDAYNFVSILYYDSWAKTEKLPDLNALSKQINPKATGVLMQSMNSVRKLVRQELYRRVDGVGTGAKFVVISFMKPSPGMGGEYVAVEKELWNPIHQQIVKSGASKGWSFWELIFPSGALQTYNYATADSYDDYAKMSTVNYEEAFKNAHPGKKIEEVFDRTGKSRQQVRVELWEKILGTEAESVAKTN